jgi:hypothetical protein
MLLYLATVILVYRKENAQDVLRACMIPILNAVSQPDTGFAVAVNQDDEVSSGKRSQKTCLLDA